MDTILESENREEPKVTFYPELYLQRRIWILNFLRKEGITRVVDVGCGEGALLNTLCQPSPWLTPPPTTLLPPSPNSSLSNPGSPSRSTINADNPPSPAYTCKVDDIPNLHMREVHGLDISDEDLVFAMQSASPPEPEEDNSEMGLRLQSLTAGCQRWEALTSKVWKGGLEVINEELIDIECIVGMEVIEHLPENILAAFAPVLLGVYHPEFLLITTPSYTFNARFTAPDAPTRTGFLDPTGRTDRIFRHNDHKFEWTREEFQAWCQEIANQWGYEVNETTIGRALQPDPWQRDHELQGATQVAAFQRLDRMSNEEREEKGRRVLNELRIEGKPHECLAAYQHPVNPVAMLPKPLEEIAKAAKEIMEKYRLSFMRMEELWFEPEIGTMCGGWIEMLVRAVEESPDLDLKRDFDGVRQGRSMWNVELIGGHSSSLNSWSSEDSDSVDQDVPEDWIPGETPYTYAFPGMEESEDGCTGAEGDVSGMEDDDEWVAGRPVTWGEAWKDYVSTEKKLEIDPALEWGQGGNWNGTGGGWGVPLSARSSTAGWDGDESDNMTS